MSSDRDLALLRRFEPIIRYTRGEEFFPIDIEGYVSACSLWVKRANVSEPICLIPNEELTLDRLGEPRSDKFGSTFFLKFADPLTAAELATYKLRTSLAQHQIQLASHQEDAFMTAYKLPIQVAAQNPDNIFHAGRGRLARVGYISRFAHALFLLSLLARGRVPGDSAAAASITYRDILSQGEIYRYCGRVARENNWIILQYWFLYAFNNWRSGFYGLNDHEADWEMICIYLSETPDQRDITPEWVAYASHDFSGDDLRRHWNDPKLEKAGEHPVIYAAAGSHASYYQAGEYLVEVEIPYLTPFRSLFGQARKFWREKLRQFYQEETRPDEEENNPNVFHLPFVDYARGDGISIGPGQEKSWATPHIISKPPLWLSQYRGLWGMYIQDPLASENAPAGPMYHRDGTGRRAWYDPLGWAGLDKLPPANQALQRIQEQHALLAVRQAELIQLIEQKSHELTGLGIEAAAVQHQPHLREAFEAHQKQIKLLSAEVDRLRAEFTENRAMLEAFQLYARRLQRGEQTPAQAHSRRAASPIPESELEIGRLMETWAAISTGLMLISLVTIILFAPQHWFIGLISIFVLLIVIEATFRRRLIKLITNVTIGLAIFATLVLFIDFFPEIALLVALATGAYMMWENLRELWS
jgi:hypothetical protein